MTRLLPQTSAGRLFAGLTFVDSIGTGVFLAGAVVFFTRHVGLTNTQIGTGLTVAGLVGLLTTVPMGVAADRFGSRPLLVGLQLWRAGCFVSLAFCSGPVSFTLVAAGLSIAESGTPALSQAVIANAVGREQLVRTMAVVRAIRNVGFSAGALLAIPLITARSDRAGLAIVLGNAASFVVAGVLLSRMRLLRQERRAADGAGPLAALFGFRDWRYLALTGLNTLFSLHLTLLPVVIPLWVLTHTAAPAGVISVLLVVNTAMAVLLQVPLSRPADRVPGAVLLMRLAGLALAGCCLAMAGAAAGPRPLAIGLLVAGMVAMTLGEIWQSAAGWKLSHDFAPEDGRVRHLAVFSLSGLAAQDILGPFLLAGLMINVGGPGWLVLAAIFVGATFLVRPAVHRLSGQVAVPAGGGEADDARTPGA